MKTVKSLTLFIRNETNKKFNWNKTKIQLNSKSVHIFDNWSWTLKKCVCYLNYEKISIFPELFLILQISLKYFYVQNSYSKKLLKFLILNLFECIRKFKKNSSSSKQVFFKSCTTWRCQSQVAHLCLDWIRCSKNVNGMTEGEKKKIDSFWGTVDRDRT